MSAPRNKLPSGEGLPPGSANGDPSSGAPRNGEGGLLFTAEAERFRRFARVAVAVNGTHCGSLVLRPNEAAEAVARLTTQLAERVRFPVRRAMRLAIVAGRMLAADLALELVANLVAAVDDPAPEPLTFEEVRAAIERRRVGVSAWLHVLYDEEADLLARQLVAAGNAPDELDACREPARAEVAT